LRVHFVEPTYRPDRDLEPHFSDDGDGVLAARVGEVALDV